ncbi:hypothetical protein D9M71_436980 [compost metagenome]
MGNQEQALAGLAPEVEGEHLHALAGQRIEGAEGFVEQQEIRLHRQRAGEPETLALATGKLGDAVVGMFLQTNQFQHLARPYLAFGLAQATNAQTQRDILQRAQPGHQRVVLEHHATLAAGAFEGAAIDLHAAAVRRLEPGQHIEQAGLAAAGRPEHHQRFALGQAQVQVAQHLAGAAVLLE